MKTKGRELDSQTTWNLIKRADYLLAMSMSRFKIDEAHFEPINIQRNTNKNHLIP